MGGVHDADATVKLGNKIKEVCMIKAKETKATDLNRSAIAAAAATLSHQVGRDISVACVPAPAPG